MTTCRLVMEGIRSAYVPRINKTVLENNVWHSRCVRRLPVRSGLYVVSMPCQTWSSSRSKSSMPLRMPVDPAGQAKAMYTVTTTTTRCNPCSGVRGSVIKPFVTVRSAVMTMAPAGHRRHNSTRTYAHSKDPDVHDRSAACCHARQGMHLATRQPCMSTHTSRPEWANAPAPAHSRTT